MYFHAFREAGFIAEQALEFGLQSVSQGFGERCQQDARFLMLAGKSDCAMERDDGFAGTGGPGYAGRSSVVALDKLALGRVKKDGPFVPGVVKRSFEFCGVANEAEAALRVWMRERVYHGHDLSRAFWFNSGRREFE